MITHIIYHISGRKVGCTKNLDKRIKWYRLTEGITPEHEILETLYDKTDQEAGDIEWAWADKFGYSRGPHFSSLTFEFRSVGGRKGGSISGIKTLKQGIGIHALTQDENRINARKGGTRLAELGRSPFQTMSREKRQEIGRSVGYIGGRRAAELKKGACQIRTICPHCGLESNLAILHRWHFDRCSHRKIRFVRRI